MNQQFDVLIIGGGVVGLSAALAMAARDFTVAVIDSGPLSLTLGLPNQRVYAINQASRILFQQLGVWSLMDESRIAPYQCMHVWDAANNTPIDFDARMIANRELGVIIEESVIKQALLQGLSAQKNITRLPLNTVTHVVSNDELVTVNSIKQTWHARLLIVADGADSPTRKLLNIPIITWPYHQHAVVATVGTEKAHQQTAYQVFNADGPLAFLPMVDRHQCSIVWSTTPARAERLATAADDLFNQEITAAFAHKLGKITLQSKRHQFPLIMRHVKQYVGKNWLLMGDAAHTIHPLAGQGLNVGLADVSAWLACLDASPMPLFSKKTLGAYQRHRKHAVWQIIALMSELKTLFANPLPPIVALRGLGLGLCNRFTPLKRLFIEQAAGIPK